ncbi:uncharacterized protein LOC111634388 [Centruroides sculpturatus]|uniref:uncharacterized protein LOC111634388 n=1 Tax=Centruroides sculpturatus TaxID=218467 RepID=UPI000C6DA521|nr:uncharacterized protein LOC111634388 [Centruroides sculpturatus]
MKTLSIIGVYNTFKNSSLCSKLYSNFILKGKFSSQNLCVEFKFKLICFMRRFRATMGISAAGFFYVKRDFLIRMVSRLYSVFSSTVDITGVMTKQKMCYSTSNAEKFLLNRTENIF